MPPSLSLNDKQPTVFRIRRDQHKRIKDIIQDLKGDPQGVLEAVRSLIQSTSMREVVEDLFFSDSEYQPTEGNPTFLTVVTNGFNWPSTEFLGTAYFFRLRPEERHVAPTL